MPSHLGNYTTPLAHYTHDFCVRTSDGRGTKTHRFSVTYATCSCGGAEKDCPWVYFKSAGSTLVTDRFSQEWYPSLEALIKYLQGWLDRTYANGTPGTQPVPSTLNPSHGRHFQKRQGYGNR